MTITATGIHGLVPGRGWDTVPTPIAWLLACTESPWNITPISTDPLTDGAKNVTSILPWLSVRPIIGSIEPEVVLQTICFPGSGFPALSKRIAVRVILPPTLTVKLDGETVKVVGVEGTGETVHKAFS